MVLLVASLFADVLSSASLHANVAALSLPIALVVNVAIDGLNYGFYTNYLKRNKMRARRCVMALTRRRR